MITVPRYVALDSAHLGQWAKDRISPKATRRDAAERFERWLERSGWVVLLSGHHFHELLTHDNGDVAVSRAQFLASLPFIAWVGDVDGSGGLGTAIDLLAAEAEAACGDQNADLLAVRERAFRRVLKTGRGDDAVFDEPDLVLTFREHLLAGRPRTRAVVALTRSKAIDVSRTTLDELLKGRLRTGDELERHLALMAGSLATDMKLRGDPRMTDHSAVAADFVAEVRAMLPKGANTPEEIILQSLGVQHVAKADLKPGMTVEQLTTLGLFRSQLHIVAEKLSISPKKLVEGVRPSDLPTWMIRCALHEHGQDRAGWPGSDMNDEHLATLAAYADATFVDRRTWEDFRRVRQHAPHLNRLLREVLRAPEYVDVPERLERA